MSQSNNPLTGDKVSEVANKTILNEDQKRKINEEFLKHCENDTKYYDEEADKLEIELKTFGISFDEFDSETKTAVDSLAEIAFILNLNDPSLTNYHLALNHLTREKFKVAAETRRLSQEESRNAKIIKELIEKANCLEKELIAAKKKNEMLTEEGNKRKTQMTFFDTKTKEYMKKVKDLQAKLEASGCQPNLYHSELVKNYEEISLMETKLKEIDAQLESYHDLPPNEELAKLKVKEAKIELKNLQKTLQQKIEEKQN